MFLFNLTHNRTHLRPYGHNFYSYIVVNFGNDWSIFADARVLTKSNMANFLIQGQTIDSSGPISSIIKLIRDLMVIYTLTKFDADWLIFNICR